MKPFAIVLVVLVVVPVEAVRAAIVASEGEARCAMITLYINLAVVWLLCGLLGAGFYIACGKKLSGHLERNRRRKVLGLSALLAVMLGPLSIAAAAVEMCRK